MSSTGLARSGTDAPPGKSPPRTFQVSLLLGWCLASGCSSAGTDPQIDLHFHVVDVQETGDGIWSYTLGVRSLEGSGSQLRGVDLVGPEAVHSPGPTTPVTLTLTNTGAAYDGASNLHPWGLDSVLGSDIYRLWVAVEGEGWSSKTILLSVPVST